MVNRMLVHSPGGGGDGGGGGVGGGGPGGGGDGYTAQHTRTTSVHENLS